MLCAAFHNATVVGDAIMRGGAEVDSGGHVLQIQQQFLRGDAPICCGMIQPRLLLVTPQGVYDLHCSSTQRFGPRRTLDMEHRIHMLKMAFLMPVVKRHCRIRAASVDVAATVSLLADGLHFTRCTPCSAQGSM